MKYTHYCATIARRPLLFVLLSGQLCLSAGAPNPPADPRPPNIVIIFTYDQGYQDVGCYGA